MSVTAHIEPEKTTCSQGCSSGADRCFFGSPGFCCRESRVGSAAGRWSRLRLLPMGYGNSRPGKLLRQEKLESTLGRQTCETASLTPSCSGNSLSPIHVCDEVRWIDLRKPGDWSPDADATHAIERQRPSIFALSRTVGFMDLESLLGSIVAYSDRHRSEIDKIRATGQSSACGSDGTGALAQSRNEIGHKVRLREDGRIMEPRTQVVCRVPGQ